MKVIVLVNGLRINIPLKERRCCVCGNNTTYIKKNGIEDWAKFDGQPCCRKCIMIIKYNPILRKRHKGSHRRRIIYKERQLLMKKNPRLGFCNLCKKGIGDEYINCFGEKAIIKQTQIHHINYHDDNPLKDTIELCRSCHAKITWKKLQLRL